MGEGNMGHEQTQRQAAMLKTREIQKITAALPNGRVETGPVQFNDDWPGTFIRGDNANHFALYLAEAIQRLETIKPDNIFLVPVLRGLLSDLQSSNLALHSDRSHPTPQKNGGQNG